LSTVYIAGVGGLDVVGVLAIAYQSRVLWENMLNYGSTSS